MRCSRFITALLAALLLMCSEVHAAGRASVLVTRVRFSTDAMTSAREALALTRLVEGEVSRAGLRMASEIDKLQSLEGDRWKPLEQCGDSSCIAEIAGASGMDYVLYTDAQDLGGSCVVSISLVSARTTEKLGMETGKTQHACTPAQLSDVVIEAVQKLLSRTVPQILARGNGRDQSPGFREGAIGEQAEEWDLGSAGTEIVAFVSEPEGAVVLLDGKLLCQTTPCSKTVATGQHKVSMQMERYQSKDETLTVKAGTKVSWTLTPDFGWLTVRSTPSGLAVKLDGKEIGKTLVQRREVARGGHEVLVSDRCFYNSGKRIKVDRGEHESVDVKPKPRQGGLQVDAEDAKGNALRAEVFVDSEKVGTTPGRFKVSICAREVEVKHGEHGSWKGKLSVKERKLVALNAVLKKVGAAPVVGGAEDRRPDADRRPGVPRAEINQIIQRNQRGLVRCIQAEVRRNPLFKGEFMVNFAILPSGSAGMVSLDNADSATPEVLGCMNEELARWRFPSFRGASFQISLPFNISR